MIKSKAERKRGKNGMQIDNTLGRRGYAGNFEKTVVQACLPHS